MLSHESKEPNKAAAGPAKAYDDLVRVSGGNAMNVLLRQMSSGVAVPQEEPPYFAQPQEGYPTAAAVPRQPPYEVQPASNVAYVDFARQNVANAHNGEAVSPQPSHETQTVPQAPPADNVVYPSFGQQAPVNSQDYAPAPAANPNHPSVDESLANVYAQHDAAAAAADRWGVAS